MAETAGLSYLGAAPGAAHGAARPAEAAGAGGADAADSPPQSPDCAADGERGHGCSNGGGGTHGAGHPLGGRAGSRAGSPDLGGAAGGSRRAFDENGSPARRPRSGDGSYGGAYTDPPKRNSPCVSRRATVAWGASTARLSRQISIDRLPEEGKRIDGGGFGLGGGAGGGSALRRQPSVEGPLQHILRTLLRPDDWTPPANGRFPFGIATCAPFATHTPACSPHPGPAQALPAACRRARCVLRPPPARGTRLLPTRLALPGPARAPPATPRLPRARRIKWVCAEAQHAFAAEGTIVDLRAPVKVFGDIHGQYADLMRLFRE